MTFALQIGQGVTGETFSLLQSVCIPIWSTFLSVSGLFWNGKHKQPKQISANVILF